MCCLVLVPQGNTAGNCSQPLPAPAWMLALCPVSLSPGEPGCMSASSFSADTLSRRRLVLAQMNTSWTGLFIVLSRKLPFFNGKFFSFHDHGKYYPWSTNPASFIQILSFRDSWRPKLIFLSHRHHWEMNIRRKPCLSLSAQALSLNKSRNILCFKRAMNLVFKSIWTCSLSLDYVYLFVTLFLFLS